jgi:putative nucleotidyltransferase with HDIG domain
VVLNSVVLNNGETTVLVVDDDESMRVYLSATLESGGYKCRSFASGGAVLGWLASGEEWADLLLSDINMPGMSGMDLLRTVRAVAPDLPVILISGLCDLPMAQGALRAGATDYLLKPVRPADLLELTSRHVSANSSGQFEAVKQALKSALGSQPATGRAERTARLMEIFDVLGLKRFETLQHSRRVAAFAVLTARSLGWSGDALTVLETGSLLHDVGKAGIPYNVLMKPGRLNQEEWAIMKMHPQLGLELLQGLPDLEQEARIVYSHHERFDGLGYPQQLAGEEIPPGARIFSVGDTLDALTSNRCYRAGQGIQAAREEIWRGAGSQFDPAVLEAFDRVDDREFEAVVKQFPDFI